MGDVRELESRIDRAIARIVAALAARVAGSAGRESAAIDPAELDRLRGELQAMREERRRDAEDVSAILADLRPLLER
jgi:hypothetical protein